MTANVRRPSSATTDTARPGRRQQLAGLRLGLAGLLLLLLVAVAAFAMRERQRAIDDVDRQVRQFADELGEGIAALLGAAAAAVGEVDRLLQAPLPPDASPWADIAERGGASAARVLASQRMPVKLLLIDAQGRQRTLGGDIQPGTHRPPAGLRPGEWLADVPEDAQPGRPLPVWRVAAPNRHGIVAYRLELSPEQVLGTLRVRNVPSAGLLFARLEANGDTYILARAPHDPTVIGRIAHGQMAESLRVARHGSYRAVSPLDNVVRVIGYRQLTGEADHLVVAYGVPQADVLGRWYELLPGLGLATALVAGLLLAGGWRLERSLAELADSQDDVAQRERQLRTLTENLPDVVVRLDDQGRHLYASPAVERATGLPPEAFLGKSNADLGMDPAQVNVWMACLGRVLAQRHTERLEFRFPGPLGERDWESLVVPEPVEAGQPPTVLVISRDITERREAEDRVRRLAEELEQRVRERTADLARSEARYRTIFDTVPVAIAEQDWSAVQQRLRDWRDQGVTDLAAHLAAHPEFTEQCLRDVRVVRRNQTAHDLHTASAGPDATALVGIHFAPPHLQQFADELLALWRGDAVHTARRQLMVADGPPRSLMLTVALPALDAADGTAMVCLVDITELDRLNAELDDSLARLRQVNQELQTFTYSVSHDLKAPLRGIDGYSRLLLQDHAAQLDEEGRRFLAHIRQATQHMGTLIDDLLAYSRLERRELALGRLALDSAVRGVTEAFEADLRARGGSLTIDVAPGLVALADAQGFAMALRNLVDNALKFARPGIAPQVRVSAQRLPGRLSVSVQDNGLGFDMKFHDRIFTIFQRLHRAEDYPGTGVGLAIVRKAMERMGGRVLAESSPGQGATFTLELPEAP